MKSIRKSVVILSILALLVSGCGAAMPIDVVAPIAQVAPEVATTVAEFVTVGHAIGAAEVARGIASFGTSPSTMIVTDGTTYIFTWLSYNNTSWCSTFWSASTQGWVGFKTGAISMAQLQNQLTDMNFHAVHAFEDLPVELQSIVTSATPGVVGYVTTIQAISSITIFLVPMIGITGSQFPYPELEELPQS